MEKALREVFFRSFEKFLAEEADNILHGTSERNLCARLAPTLETSAHGAGFNGYYADVEYNRMQEGRVKTLLDDHLRIVRITCDLILHSRGQIVERDNLIAIEMKRIEHPDSEKSKDRDRLRALTKKSYDGVWSADGKTLPEHVCGYSLGYFAELNATGRSFRIEEYLQGNLSDVVERGF